MDGRLASWLVGVRLGHYRAVRTCHLQKKKKRQNLPSLSEPCLRPEASGGRLALRKLLLLCGALEMAPAARPLRPWANIQVKQWQTLSRFRRSEMGGGGVQDLASEFFFPFVCLPLIDCGELGLRPQRSEVKDVRCRVNEATLIRFWPPSALTSSSRTPVPWRGDTFDLRLVLSASRCAFIILFFTSELDTSRDL